MTRKELIYAPWVVELVVLAREFCDRLEARQDGAPWAGDEYAQWLYQYLGLLLYKGARMPDLEDLAGVPVEACGDFELTAVNLRVSGHLGEINSLRLDSTPSEQAHYASEPTMSELVVSIYRHFIVFLRAYQDGVEERMQGAVHFLRASYGEGWGRDALLAFRGLFEVFAGDSAPSVGWGDVG